MGIKWIAIGAAVLFILGTVAAGYIYVTKLQADLLEAEKRTQALADAKVIQDKTIADLQSNDAKMVAQAQANQKAVDDLARSSAQQQATVDKLAVELQRHNLGKLSDAKPKLVQGAINRGTGAAFDRLRAASRAHTGQGDIGRVAKPPVVPPAAPRSP